MKNILAFIGLLVVLAGGAYWYLNRPVANPTAITINNNQLTSADGTLYRISPDDSTLSFSINEVLRDNPFLAVGTSNAVSGDIAIGDNQINFGTLSVNARTFVTDDARRDGALARLILKSEKAENEFITFTPTGFNRLPKKIPSSSEFSFTLLGDLTISGVTKPASFEITMKVSSASITGTVSGTLKRSDFDITIPSIPFVASVEDTFTISGTVVAKRVE